MYAPSMRNSDFFTIQFTHIPTKKKASFEGWVTTFSDNFSSQWNEVPVYGRMDPLSTFMRTSRKIQLAFDVPSDNLENAEGNLQAVNDLITFLYPVYEQQAGTGKQRVGQTIQAAPLIGLKWANLVADPSDNSELIGYLDGVNYGPKIEDGGFYRPGAAKRASDTSAGEAYDLEQKLGEAARRELANLGGNQTLKRTYEPIAGYLKPQTEIYIPKTLSISLNFTVLHKHLPGWIMSQSEDLGYIFGNNQVDRGFPNTQVKRSVPASALQTTTTTTTDKDGNVEVIETTQLVTALGAEVLSSTGTPGV